MVKRKKRKQREVNISFDFIKQMSDRGKNVGDLREIEKSLGGRQ